MASQKVHGITIDLDVNTSGINEAFKDINKSLNATQKELTQVDKLLKIDPKNTTLLAQKQYLLSSAIEDTKNKMVQLAKAKKQADDSGEIDKSSKQYRDLERDLINTKNSLDKLTKQFNENEDAIKGVAKESNSLVSNLKNATNNASQFGDMLKAKVVGEAIIDGVKALANAFVNIGKSIYNSVRDSGKLADDINTLASQYNLSTKEIQQFMKASDLVDVELSTITKSFQKLTKQMTSTSKETTNAFKKLNVSVKDSNGELRSSNDVFYETIEALGQIKNETEQDSLAMAIFGKSSAELGSLIGEGSKELAEFNKYLEANNLLLSDEELTNLNDMNDSFDVLNATFDSLKQKLASEIAPAIKPLVDELSDFIVQHKDNIISLVKEVVEYLTSDEARATFEQITDAISNFVSTELPKLIQDLPTILKDIKDLSEVLGGIAKIIITIVDALKWAFEHRANDNARIMSDLGISSGSFYGAGGRSFSGGFGATQSGGFSNQITLNASFVANGNLDEAQALRFADLMTARINENLGQQI